MWRSKQIAYLALLASGTLRNLFNFIFDSRVGFSLLLPSQSSLFFLFVCLFVCSWRYVCSEIFCIFFLLLTEVRFIHAITSSIQTYVCRFKSLIHLNSNSFHLILIHSNSFIKPNSFIKLFFTSPNVMQPSPAVFNPNFFKD